MVTISQFFVNLQSLKLSSYILYMYGCTYIDNPTFLGLMPFLN